MRSLLALWIVAAAVTAGCERPAAVGNAEHDHDEESAGEAVEDSHGGHLPESLEGRTTIAANVAAAAGIVTVRAGPATIAETVLLYGSIAPDAARVREVRARFPGAIATVRVAVGERVAAGAALATIEANESLQTYTLAAPIAGIVLERHAQPGEQTDAAPLFLLADLSSVWAELRAFPRDRARLAAGLAVRVRGDAGAVAASVLDYLSPIGDPLTQSVVARATLANGDGRWTPGQFVEGEVAVASTPVALAVPLSAVQRFRDVDVVFARVGDDYEVRMLELGRRDAERVEVTGGLEPGTEIVVDNSYLVLADIEKAGASHDH